MSLSQHPTGAPSANLNLMLKRRSDRSTKQRSVNFQKQIATKYQSTTQPAFGFANTTTATSSGFHRLGLNSRLQGNRSFVDGSSVSMLNH
jgi:hypothetical protein